MRPAAPVQVGSPVSDDSSGYAYPPAPDAQTPTYDDDYPPPPPVYYPFQPAGPPPGYRTHDGLFLRANSGIGFMRANYSDSGYDTTISGSGIALSFALGGALTRNLIVYGEGLFFSQEFDAASQTGTGPSRMIDGCGLLGVGPGVAYYLEPANFYFSGTVALSRVLLTESLPSESAATRDHLDTGFGFAATVGKEWWASDNWGLGVAGLFHGASMKMTLPNTRIFVAALSILFSATYN